MKKLITGTLTAATAFAAGSTLLADVPEVTEVTMAQDASRLVTIEYSLANAPAVVTLDVQTNATVNGETVWASIGGTALQNARGDVWKQITEGGKHTITWRPDLSWPGHKIAEGGARAVVTAWALDNTPNYMVVELSDAAGAGTERYYPSADFLPGGLLGNGAYRTTKLVMRKIMAKDVGWMMGSTTLEAQRPSSESELTHPVTLENNYYIGVFEITQAQWDLVQTARLAPSKFTNAEFSAMRPCDNVCYNEIRNAANKTEADTRYDWPADPNPGSFLGKLRAKTGIDTFDLPSEAQWEFAARAGHGSPYWGDGSRILGKDKDEEDANLVRLGRYLCNGGKVWDGSNYVDAEWGCGATNGTAVVGSYAPNDWGIYDAHGNVWEWCLDWHTENITGLNGAVNVAAGTKRVMRGGSFWYAASTCRPANRGCYTPATRRADFGFRVVCTAGLR